MIVRLCFALLLALCGVSAAAAFAAALLVWEMMPFTTLVREEARQESLVRANDACLARKRFQRDLVFALVANRLTLAEAVVRLEEHHEREAVEAAGMAEDLYGRGVLHTVPGSSDRERCGRNLILLVKSHLDTGRGPQDFITRLEAELQRIVQTDGRGPSS